MDSQPRKPRRPRGIYQYNYRAGKSSSQLTKTYKEKREPDFTKISSYEDYLDFYVTDKDIFHLESEDMARTIVTLGYRYPELLSREEFYKKLKKIRSDRDEKLKALTVISYSISSNIIKCPLMRELAQHEENNRDVYEACIIFIRDRNSKGHEISGYIDYKQRLRLEEEKWTDYFTHKEKLLPTQNDLAFYNWYTFFSKTNSSSNYTIVTDVQKGLGFKNKVDREVVYVNTKADPGNNTIKKNIDTPFYEQATIFIHSNVNWARNREIRVVSNHNENFYYIDASGKDPIQEKMISKYDRLTKRNSWKTFDSYKASQSQIHKEAQKTIDKALDIEPESVNSLDDASLIIPKDSIENAQDFYKKSKEKGSEINLDGSYYSEEEDEEEEVDEDESQNYQVNNLSSVKNPEFSDFTSWNPLVDNNDEEEEEDFAGENEDSVTVDEQNISPSTSTSFVNDIPVELIVPDSTSTTTTTNDPVHSQVAPVVSVKNEKNGLKNDTDGGEVRSSDHVKSRSSSRSNNTLEKTVPQPSQPQHQDETTKKSQEIKAKSKVKDKKPPAEHQQQRKSSISNESLNQLTKEKFELQNRVDVLNKEIGHLRSTLNESQKKSYVRESELKTENVTLKRKIQDYELKFSEISFDIADTTAPMSLEIEKLQRELKLKSVENEKVTIQLHSNMKQLELNLKCSTEREKSLKELNISLESTIQNLEQSIEKMANDNKRLEECSQAEIKALGEKIEKFNIAEKLLNDLKVENEKLKSDCDHLDNQLKEERSLYEIERKKHQSQLEQIQMKKSFNNNHTATGSIEEENSPPHSFISEASYLEEVFDPSNNIHNSLRSMTPKSYFESFPSGNHVGENFHSQLRLREHELMQYQEESIKSEKLRKTLNNEIANLTILNQELAQQNERMKELELKLEEMEKNYSALLQMYGEKVEEADELKLDLQDVKEMYKVQIEQLLNK